jgi:DNA repair exonuclease SbcCD nuclease subunit
MKTIANNLIGVIGDLHMRERLSYADHISDGRVAERKGVLDFIVKSFEDCKHIVLLGDIFHHKNNSSEVNREFVEFIERFGDKEIYMISGNHSKKGDGKTAIDFIREIKRDNWHVHTTPGSHTIKNGTESLKLDFLPNMLNSELEVETCEEATEKIMEELKGGDILFVHHAISGTTFNGIKTELLKEVVLSKEKLEEKYKAILAGHIHQPQQVDKVTVTGSVFTEIVGEIERFIWKIDSNLSMTQYMVPNRGILKIEGPTDKQIEAIKNNSIVKVVVTKKDTDIPKLKEALTKFDAALLIENYPNERKKAHVEGAFDFSIEALLKLYSEEKEVDLKQLLKGLELIND